MVEKDGIILASLIGGGSALNGLVSEGGFISPEFLNSLSGMDIKTVALVVGILYFTRKKKAGVVDLTDVICPYSEKKE